MVYEEYSRLLFHRTGLYRTIGVRPYYTKIDEDRVRNSVSLNMLRRVAKKRKL